MKLWWRIPTCLGGHDYIQRARLVRPRLRTHAPIVNQLNVLAVCHKRFLLNLLSHDVGMNMPRGLTTCSVSHPKQGTSGFRIPFPHLPHLIWNPHDRLEPTRVTWTWCRGHGFCFYSYFKTSMSPFYFTIRRWFMIVNSQTLEIFDILPVNKRFM